MQGTIEALTTGDGSEPVVVNLGPQHPSTHGVFRLKVTLDGEIVQDAEMRIGYLHRSMEKLAEERTYTQNIPFTDRIDYLAAMSNNLAYCLAAEELLGIEVPPRASAIRVMFAELQRVASHAMANGTFINDCGAWHTPLFHMFRDRERVLDMFEMTCGARLTTNYMRIGGVAFDLPDELLPTLEQFLADMPENIANYEALLLENEILHARARGIGVISPEMAINSSLSGPVLRATGVPWDLRKANPYCGYEDYEFDVPVGEQGDCFDRFLVRMAEVKESLRILRQVVDNLPDGPWLADVPLHARPEAGEAYARVESPRGELGFYLVSDGGPAPYRFHCRPPSLINLSALKEMSIGGTLADAIVTLGSIDIVVGEIDR
ncbi:MAG: NADH-quinone oxidoreductase subunit D [Chloroflexi bacterium]|nr:NADH-quinone oxidoreductase subunit D [Chloroflexota bacterium]